MSPSTSDNSARRSPRRSTALLITCALGLTVVTATGPPASAAEPVGTLVTGTAASATLGGPINFTTYLPPGYAYATERYPTLYLLHGRGDTQSAWTQVSGDLDAMIADGSVPPVVVVMPDAPWSNGGNWYVDSQYTGTDPSAGGPGLAVETALTRDLIAHIDATYRTVDDRSARAVGGYSMGGAGALRYVLAHQDVFSAAIVLSPAVYVPAPPADSSTRDYGAYGVGTELFTQARYDALNYPAGLAAVDPALPVHLFIAVGDDEYANPSPKDARHDLDLESAQLYNAARRVPGVSAELRVMNGGHEWTVWRPGFREGLADVASYLKTTVPEPLRAAFDFSQGVVVPTFQRITTPFSYSTAVVAENTAYLGLHRGSG